MYVLRNVFVWVHSVSEAILLIEMMENNGEKIELIDCDHNLSDYYQDRLRRNKVVGLAVQSTNFLSYCVHIANPVGIDNMLR